MVKKKQNWIRKKATKKTPLVLFSGKSFIQVSRKLTKSEQNKMKVRADENTNDPEWAWDFGNVLSWFYQKK